MLHKFSQARRDFQVDNDDVLDAIIRQERAVRRKRRQINATVHPDAESLRATLKDFC